MLMPLVPRGLTQGDIGTRHFSQYVSPLGPILNLSITSPDDAGFAPLGLEADTAARASSLRAENKVKPESVNEPIADLRVSDIACSPVLSRRPA